MKRMLWIVMAVSLLALSGCQKSYSFDSLGSKSSLDNGRKRAPSQPSSTLESPLEALPQSDDEPEEKSP
ncbi:MAG: hypothetical protein HQL53_13940 [Magnetococcales bacterium]|nr:hypothetical protein [Magnetococcales bacterium]